MIRTYQNKDIEQMVALWLAASLIAHDFIPKQYWESQQAAMREQYIPASQSYVYVEGSTVLGFVSLVEAQVAALFVAPQQQGKGIGQQLLDYVKGTYNGLELAVYADNTAAIHFYKRQGFTAQKQQIDPHTGCEELLMCYQKCKA